MASACLGLPLWAAGILAGLSLLNDGLLVQTAYLGSQGRPAETTAATPAELRSASGPAAGTQAPWLDSQAEALRPATAPRSATGPAMPANAFRPPAGEPGSRSEDEMRDQHDD